MRLRALLVVVLVAGGLAACGGETAVTEATDPPAATTTTATASTTAVPTTTAGATTSTSTTAVATGMVLGSDSEQVIATLASLAEGMGDARDLAMEFNTGGMPPDVMDSEVHALYGGMLPAWEGAFQLQFRYIPGEATDLLSAAMVATDFAIQLDGVLFWWDQTWDDAEGTTADDVLTFLDGDGSAFLAAYDAAMAQLEALGVDPGSIAAIQADPGSVLAGDGVIAGGDDDGDDDGWQFIDDGTVEALQFGEWSWGFADLEFLGSEQPLRVYSHLTNSGPDPISLVEMTVDLLDADGVVVDSHFALMDPAVIYPGETILVWPLGWNDSLHRDAPDLVAGVEVTIESAKWYDGAQGFHHQFAIAMEDAPYRVLGQTVTYRGTVTNEGELPQQTVIIRGIAYDAGGAVIGVGEGGIGIIYLNGDFSHDFEKRLEPGDSSDCEVNFRLWWPGEIARFELIAEGTDGSSPDF